MPSPQEVLGWQQDALSKLIAQTDPLRAATTKRLQDVLSGGIPISSMAEYSPLRAAIEGQFNTAQNQLQASLPRGGVLQSSMADLIGKRAGAVSMLDKDLLSQAQNQAASIGFGQLPTAISGLGSSASILANQQAQQAAQQANAWSSGIGGLGLLAALLVGGFGGNQARATG